MTYKVLGGTLSLTQSINQSWIFLKHLLVNQTMNWESYMCLYQEGVSIMTGMTYNGKDEDGNTLWDSCANIRIRNYEKASTCQELILAFNINTNRWMAKWVSAFAVTCFQGWLDIYRRYVSLIRYFRSKISDIFYIFDNENIGYFRYFQFLSSFLNIF